MNGLKIYLKSGVGVVYHYALLAGMLLLLTNGILQLEWVQAPFEIVGVNFFAATVLFVGFLLPRRLRKRFRLLPGLLIALGGFAMYWTTRGEKWWITGDWTEILYGVGIGMMAFGLLQAVIDVKGWVKLSARSMRVKRGILPMQRIEWSRIKDVYVEDGRLNVELKQGGSLRMRLMQGESQTLKARIDQIYLEARTFQRNLSTPEIATVAP